MKKLFLPLRDQTLNSFFGIDGKKILNEGKCDRPAAKNLPAQIAHSLLALKKAAIITDQGVDYHKLAVDGIYLHFRDKTAPSLKRFDLNGLDTREEKLAFWINLYNLLTLDAVIQMRIRKSVAEGWFGVIRFFRQAAYNVGGFRFSLEDIEHGILRANHGFPFFPGKQFSKADARMRFVIDNFDLRIHFALNCASRSCPPIAYYTPTQINNQLEKAAVHFIGTETSLEKSGVMLIISRIFKWYLRDFGGQVFMLGVLMNYLPVDDMRRLLIENFRENVMVQFAHYDWRLNDLGKETR